MADLLSIAEAAQRGIDRVRKPNWANPLDHLKIDLVPGGVGPWLHLYAPFNKQCNGRDPVAFLWCVGAMKTDIYEKCVEPYIGPLPDSPEYQAAVANFEPHDVEQSTDEQ